MSTQPSGSKRKRAGPSILNNLLHPGEWRGKRARSGSPSASGASSPGHSHSPFQSNSSSRNPSPTRSSQPLLPSHGLPNATPHTHVPPANAAGPTTGAPNSTRNATGPAWTGLEQALRVFHITTKICPTLSAAVDVLVSCLPMFEEAARSRSDYHELANGLKSMVDLLIRHLNNTTSEEVLDAITGIAEAIRKEVESISMYQSCSLPRRAFDSSSAEDDLIRRYRRIEQLFRQLHGESSLGTWSTVNELLVEKHLEKLDSAKYARFDSVLSTEFSRRGCTKDTRTAVLENSIAWSENPDVAKIYWMNGMAGTGKTTIAYSFCERLKARKQLAASFFCTRASAECCEAKQIIPTLAYQLARCFAPFRYSLCQQLKLDPDIGKSQISEQFDMLLKKPLLASKDKLSNNLVIVVDALDECNDPLFVESFLGLLFRSVVELPIKFFVTSRPEPVIRNKMMPESEHSRSILYLHEIERSLVQADIERYLREELASIVSEDADIQELAEHSDNLFIYAATAVRYIRPAGKAVNSKARLTSILAIGAESKEKLSAIDKLYKTILAAAIDDKELEPEEQNQMRLVLWTTICACEPMFIHTLSTLSGLDNKEDTMTALQPLRSVLHVSDHTELVTTLHASFPDYILDKERSGVFHCDKATHSQLLAERCFRVMKAQLRFNICSIQSSFIPNNEVSELGEQINANIPGELFYVCRFWVDHFTETSPQNPLLDLLYGFLSQRLLFWMEVMSLKKCMDIGAMSVTRLHTWLTQVHMGIHGDLLALVSDARRFVANYASSPASSFTPHIYLSALPLNPPSNFVRSWYLPRFKGLIKVSGTIFDCLENAALGTWASASSIRSAAFSLDGSRIILGDERGRISVQNAYDGKYIIQPFKAHKKRVNSLGVSRDGTQIVSGSQDMTLSVWNAHNGLLISGPFKGHNSRVTSVAFSPNATQIVSGSEDSTVGIWNPHNEATPMRSLTGHGKGVHSVAFSPDGLYVISGSADHTVRLWDLSTGTTVFDLQGHTGTVSSVQFSPDGAHIISGSYDCTIRMWNTSNGTISGQPLKGHSGRITSIDTSPDGTRIVSSSLDCTIRVWDRQSGGLIAGPFEGHVDSIRSVGISGDGTRVVSASDDRTVRVWDIRGQMSQTKKAQKPSNRHYRHFTSSPNQTRVAFSCTTEPRTFHIWDLQTITHLSFPTTAKIALLQFSLDGTRIYSAHIDTTICTWDVQTAELLDGPHRCSTAFDFGNATPRFALSFDGTRAITYSGGKAELELRHLQSDRSIVICASSDRFWADVIFSQVGTSFLTSSASGVNYELNSERHIDIWDANSGTRLNGPFVVGDVSAFSPCGTYVCCKPPDGIHLQLINVNNGGIVSMPTREPGDIHSHRAEFTPDGLHVAAKGPGDIIEIWNIRGQIVTSLTVRTTVETILTGLLGFSSDGWLLCYELLRGGSVQIWRIHKDYPPFTVSPEGWVLNNQGRPWLWVPTDIRKSFPVRDAVIVSGGDLLQSVQYGDMLVGDDWSKCFIGD